MPGTGVGAIGIKWLTMRKFYNIQFDKALFNALKEIQFAEINMQINL